MFARSFTKLRSSHFFLQRRAFASFSPKSEKFDIEIIPENKYIYLTPKSEHKYSLIFLHGLGDSAMGFFDVFSDPQNQFNLTPPNCRIVLPTAPVQPVTLNQGYEMNSWFDVFNLSPA